MHAYDGICCTCLKYCLKSMSPQITTSMGGLPNPCSCNASAFSRCQPPPRFQRRNEV